MVSDEAAREAASEILAQHRYARWNDEFEAWLRAFDQLVEWIPDGLIDALRWFQEVVIQGFLVEILGWIGRFLRLFGVLGQTPSALGWVAVCLLLALAMLLAYRFFGEGGRDARTPIVARRPSRTHAEAIAESKALAREGRFLEAAHRVQLATLAMLIEFDWLELARADPNRTLRQRVAASSLPERERRLLISLVDRLERLWFDEPREDPDLFEAWIDLDARLVRVATGGVR